MSDAAPILEFLKSKAKYPKDPKKYRPDSGDDMCVLTSRLKKLLTKMSNGTLLSLEAKAKKHAV